MVYCLVYYCVGRISLCVMSLNQGGWKICSLAPSNDYLAISLALAGTMHVVSQIKRNCMNQKDEKRIIGLSA